MKPVEFDENQWHDYDDLVGKGVFWTKVKGKENASMHEKEGFGMLICYTPYVCIVGDRGVRTSLVINVEELENSIRVTTMNSVYEIVRG